jgi:HSP20 family protein
MLLRFDPFRELDDLLARVWDGRETRYLPMDAYRHGDTVVVHLDLPGIDPASVDLTVEKDVLTVKAERDFALGEGDEVIVAERPHGTFVRRVFLGESLDADRVQAHYDRGVLTVTIPVAETARKRRVEIATERPQAIEATAA